MCGGVQSCDDHRNHDARVRWKPKPGKGFTPRAVLCCPFRISETEGLNEFGFHNLGKLRAEIEKLNQALRVLEGIGGKRAKIKRAKGPRRKIERSGQTPDREGTNSG
jgi:hypothetical protein